MPDLKTTIPILYAADVVHRDETRRVCVASSLDVSIPLRPTPKDEFQFHLGRTAHTSLFRREGRRYSKSERLNAASVLGIARGADDRHLHAHDLSHTLVGGVEAFLHVFAAGSTTLLNEEDLSRLEVVSHDRDVVVGRTERLASFCFADTAEPHEGWERDIWTPLKDVFLARNNMQGGMKPLVADVAPFDRWRTQSTVYVRGPLDARRLPRLTTLDRDYDPAHGLVEAGGARVTLPKHLDDVSIVPEAAMNTLAFARILRTTVVPRTIGRRLSYDAQEAVGTILETIAAYEDVHSPPPTTDATAAELLRCAAILTTRACELSIALEPLTSFHADVRWFETYWEGRGPKMSTREASLPSLGYGDEHAPTAEREAEYLAMGF